MNQTEKQRLKNYAFIDSQNLNLGIQSLRWKSNYHKFRVYLREKYQVNVAYLFIGYLAGNQNLYSALQSALLKKTVREKIVFYE